MSFYNFSLYDISHNDLEGWAGRTLTKAQADDIFKQIEQDVEDGIYDVCMDVISQFEFAEESEDESEDEPAGAPEAPEALAEWDRIAAEYAVFTEEVRAAQMEERDAASASHFSEAQKAYDAAREAAKAAYDAAVEVARAVLNAAPERQRLLAANERCQRAWDAQGAFQKANLAWYTSKRPAK
jgi:hypothetical protein